MTPEEVAARYELRTGYRLIDYAEVALPMYVATVRAITMERKRLPVIEEFALKAIAAGLTTAAEVCGILGIHDRVLKPALVTLARNEQITLTGATGSRSHVLKLTSKGQTTLADAEMTVPEEDTFLIVLDAVTRTVSDRRTSELLRPRDLRNAAYMEIPNMYPSRPTVTDVSVREVEAYLNLVTTDDRRRDVLTIKGVERVERRFLPAVGLFYREEHGDEVQVAFAIDGRTSAGHERAFAAGDGVELLRLKEGLRQTAEETRLVQRAIDAAITKVPGAAAGAAIAKEVARKQAAVAALERTVDTEEDAARKKDAERQVDSALHAVEEERRRLAEAPAVPLSCYEHPPVLRRAIADAHEALLILSPWITPAVVTREFMRELTRLLQRGVRLYIGYGLGEDKPSSESVLKDLEGLAAKFPNFLLRRIGNTHSKVLIQDDALCVITSFNWLSFRGDANRTIRDERGVLLRDPAFVRQQLQTEIRTFFKT